MSYTLYQAWSEKQEDNSQSINFLIFELDLALTTLVFRILRTTKKARTTKKG